MNIRMKLNGQMKKLKLVHQINFAFGLSMVLVLSITGVMIHFVLMDHFIGKEQEGLRTLGATLTASMQQQPAAAISAVPIEENELFPVQYATLSSGVQAIVTDQQGRWSLAPSLHPGRRGQLPVLLQRSRTACRAYGTVMTSVILCR